VKQIKAEIHVKSCKFEMLEISGRQREWISMARFLKVPRVILFVNQQCQFV
jgi:hypothetical protein